MLKYVTVIVCKKPLGKGKSQLIQYLVEFFIYIEKVNGSSALFLKN